MSRLQARAITAAMFQKLVQAVQIIKPPTGLLDPLLSLLARRGVIPAMGDEALGSLLNLMTSLAARGSLDITKLDYLVRFYNKLI